MATGGTLVVFRASEGLPPASNAAGLVTVNTVDPHLVLTFDDTTDEAILLEGVLPTSYAGLGIDVQVWYAMATAATGAISWEVAVERLNDGFADTTTSSFAAVNEANETVPGTDDTLSNLVVAFTDGADMDSLAAGEPFRLKVNRNVGVASNASGDAHIYRVVIEET